MKLRDRLARQWTLLALGLALMTGVLAILALYMVEDHFLDRELGSVAGRWQENPAQPLPGDFTFQPESAWSPVLRARLGDAPVGAVREFALTEQMYVHALRLAAGPQGEAGALVFDVSRRMTVNAVLASQWHWLLVILALVMLLTRAAVQRAARALTDETLALVSALQDGDTPQTLQAYAQRAGIDEFATLAQHNAAILQARFDALDREREMLAFLQHELRTPLQTARASLDVLLMQEAAEPDMTTSNTTASNMTVPDTTVPDASSPLPAASPGSPLATPPGRRLQRAIRRLERVAMSVGWLAGNDTRTGDAAASVISHTAASHAPVAVAPIVRALIDEFADLATRKQCHFVLTVDEDLHWPLPAAVLETLLANLLLNALQHGSSGEIRIDNEGRQLRIDNAWIPSAAAQRSADGGLGLQIVARWAQRFHLRVHSEARADRWRVTVQPLMNAG